MSLQWLVFLFAALVLSPGRRLSGLSFTTRLTPAPNQFFTFGNCTPAPAGSLAFTGLPVIGVSRIPGEYEPAW